MSDYKFEKVPVHEIAELRLKLLKKYGNNKSIKEVIEKEVQYGNIFHIITTKYINTRSIHVKPYIKGGYVTKEFIEGYNFSGYNYLNNSWISENSVVLGEYCHSFDSHIKNSLLIGKFNISNCTVRDSLLIDKRSIDMYGSCVYHCKVYNRNRKDFEIIRTVVSDSVIRESIINQSTISNSVIRNSAISGNIEKSLVCNLCSNTFKVYKNHVTDQFDMIVIANIGSRGDYTTFIKQIDGIHVNVGCFHGTLEEFKERLEKRHGPDNGGSKYIGKIYYNQYKLAVDYVESVWKIIDEIKNEFYDFWEVNDI